MTARFAFAPSRRGPPEPPEVTGYIDWRPEAAKPWWAVRAGVGKPVPCATLAEAQQELRGGGNVKGAANG